MFEYDPKDADAPLAPDGEYDAEIETVEEEVSKAGNAMLKLTVRIWAGATVLVLFDYVVNPKLLWKLKQIAAAIGKSQEFQDKKLKPQDIRGATLRVFLKTRKDETGKYPDQNVITKYLASTPASQTPGADEDADKMPF